MFLRLSKPLLSNSFFVFGARGTGKSTLVKGLLPSDKTLFIDLLRADDEDRFAKDPTSLISEIQGKLAHLEWVMIDEVQKIPKILDTVHHVMEVPGTDTVDETHAKVLHSFRADFPDSEFYILSNDQRPKKFGTIKALHWVDGLKEIGLS